MGGRLHEGEQAAQSVELPATRGRKTGVSTADLLEYFAVPLLRPWMRETLGKKVGDALACRDHEDERGPRLSKRPDVAKDPVRVGQGGAPEFEDHRPDSRAQCGDPPFQVRRPFACASSALRTDAPAPPRTALCERTKNRR